MGIRQRVEIVRCLLQNPKLIIMDEPTSVLTPQEVEVLFQTLRRLAADWGRDPVEPAYEGWDGLGGRLLRLRSLLGPVVQRGAPLGGGLVERPRGALRGWRAGLLCIGQ